MRKRARSSPRRSKSLSQLDKNVNLSRPLIRDDICHNCTDSAYMSHARRYCKKYDRVYNVKTRKCDKKKKGGSKKKMNTAEFKKFLLGKEKKYMNKKTICNRTCSKIKNKNKIIKLIKKKKCNATCEKERLTNIQKIHKQYPKEFKQYIKEFKQYTNNM